jgi:hypothetical protein
MAYFDAILNSELFAYITATILITTAVWLFAGLYSSATCANVNDDEKCEKRTMCSKSWFKFLLAIVCAAFSVLLIYRSVSNMTCASQSYQPKSEHDTIVTGGSLLERAYSDASDSDNFN